MKKIKLLGILLLPGTLYAQQINLNNNNVIQPNYGLAITGTGMTLCMIGTTMNQTAQIQYSTRYGHNYVNHDLYDNRTLRLSTMAIGAIVTLTGILIQNKNRKNG